MAVQTGTLKFRRMIKSPEAELFRAFTNATALREWLCDSALADPHKGGKFYAGWNDGGYASGEYLMVEPGRVIISWLGKGEPEATRVQAAWRAQGDGTLFTLTHSGFAKGRSSLGRLEAFERRWTEALENLQAGLETGVDLRLTRRPLLGISGAVDVTAEDVERLRLAVREGVRIDGVVEGLSASLAGLQGGDVITRLGARPVRSWASLIGLLQKHRAGDRVKVTYYRGGEKRQVELTLTGRPIPDIPATPAELAATLREKAARVLADLREFLEGVDEQQAARRPAPNEWSVKENLAHFIDGERGFQYWMGCVVQSQEPDNILDNLNERLEAIVCIYPTIEELIGEYTRLLAETAAFAERLPAGFLAHRRSYWHLAYSLLEGVDAHVHSHLEQMRAALAPAQ